MIGLFLLMHLMPQYIQIKVKYVNFSGSALNKLGKFNEAILMYDQALYI